MIFRLAEIGFSFSGDFFAHLNPLKTNAVQNAVLLSEILISRIPCEVYVRQVHPFPLGVKTKAGRKVLWTPLPAISLSYGVFFDGCSVDYCLPPAFQKFSSFSIFAF